MHCNLGVVLLQKGSIDEAIEEFRTAVGFDPNLIRAQRELQKALGEKAERGLQ